MTRRTTPKCDKHPHRDLVWVCPLCVIDAIYREREMLDKIRAEGREPTDEELAAIAGKETSREFHRFASLGGKKRWKGVSKAERKKLAHKAAHSGDRSAIGRRAAEARWKKERE